MGGMMQQGNPSMCSKAVYHGQTPHLATESKEGVIRTQGPLRHFVLEVKVPDKGYCFVGHAVSALDADAPNVKVQAQAAFHFVGALRPSPPPIWTRFHWVSLKDAI